MKDSGETGEPKEPWEPPEDDPVVPGPRGQHSTLARLASEEFERYRQGDEASLNELVKMLTPVLWHTVRALRLDPESTQDVVHATWLALVGNAKSITPGSVLSWLRDTARQEAVRVLRQKRSGMAGNARPEPPVIQLEHERVLWAHVDALPHRCRTLLRVIAFADRPDYPELARSLDMPIGSIGPTRGRCLAMLRKSLSQDGRWALTNELEPKSVEELSVQPPDEGDVATLRAIAVLYSSIDPVPADLVERVQAR